MNKNKEDRMTVDLGNVEIKAKSPLWYNPDSDDPNGYPVLNNVFEFKMGIYPRALWIAVGASPDDLNKLFPDGDSNGDPFMEMDPSDDGIVDEVERLIPSPYGGVLIRFNSINDINFDSAAHECCHTAFSFFRYINSVVSSDTEETFCYLLGYLAKCCEFVKNKLSK